MIIFYLINPFIVIALYFWPYWFSLNQLQLERLNPFLIFIILGLPFELMKIFGGPLFLIDDGIYDEGYQFSLLVTNVALLSQWLSAFIFFRLFKRIRFFKHLKSQARLLNVNKLRCYEFTLLLAGIFSWVILAISDFGLLNWLQNPREGYQLHRTGLGHWYAISISFIALSMLISYARDPKPTAILSKFVFFTFLSYFTGSKGVMLSFFTSTLVFLMIMKWAGLKNLLLALTPLIFSLLIFNLYLALGDSLSINTLFEYFDYYKNASMFYNDYLNDRISLFHGEIALSSYYSYLPRAIWIEKPYSYGILLINEIYYPGQAELTNTPAFGGYVEQFADFGFFSVITSNFLSFNAFSCALAGFILAKNQYSNTKKPTTPLLISFIIYFLPSFGMFFPGALYGILILLAIAIFNSSRIPHPITVR
jgi:hypothetical protein